VTEGVEEGVLMVDLRRSLGEVPLDGGIPASPKACSLLGTSSHHRMVSILVIWGLLTPTPLISSPVTSSAVTDVGGAEA
jgi:hypothetical protein